MALTTYVGAVKPCKNICSASEYLLRPVYQARPSNAGDSIDTKHGTNIFWLTYMYHASIIAVQQKVSGFETSLAGLHIIYCLLQCTSCSVVLFGLKAAAFKNKCSAIASSFRSSMVQGSCCRHTSRQNQCVWVLHALELGPAFVNQF